MAQPKGDFQEEINEHIQNEIYLFISLNEEYENLDLSQEKEVYIISKDFLEKWKNKYSYQTFQSCYQISLDNYQAIDLDQLNRDLIESYTFNDPELYWNSLKNEKQQFSDQNTIIIRPGIQESIDYIVVNKNFNDFFKSRFDMIELKRRNKQKLSKNIPIHGLKISITQMKFKDLQNIENEQKAIQDKLELEFEKKYLYIVNLEELDEIVDYLRKVLGLKNKNQLCLFYFNSEVQKQSYFEEVKQKGQFIENPNQCFLKQGQQFNIEELNSLNLYLYINNQNQVNQEEEQKIEELDQQNQINELNPSVGIQQQEQQISDSQQAGIMSEEGIKYISGITGLFNMGNTCYMNSALICLSNVEDLKEYFFSQVYLQEINYQNKLGTSGVLVKQTVQLFKELWQGKEKAILPSQFKKVFDQFYPIFEMGVQHDSQEFLNFLLDGIHEDLNRIKQKKTLDLEKINQNGMNVDQLGYFHWKNHLNINQSIIVDLFYGQLKSEIICQICHKKSNKFDPFMSFQLPLPEQKSYLFEVFFISQQINKKAQQLKISFYKDQKISHIKHKVAEITSTEPQRLIFVLGSYSTIQTIDNQYLAQLIKNQFDGKQIFCLEVADQDIKLFNQNKNIPCTLRISEKFTKNNEKQLQTFSRIIYIAKEQQIKHVILKILNYFVPLFNEHYKEEIQTLNLIQKQEFIYSNQICKIFYLKEDLINDKEVPIELEKNSEVGFLEMVQKNNGDLQNIVLEIEFFKPKFNLKNLNTFEKFQLKNPNLIENQMEGEINIYDCFNMSKKGDMLDKDNQVFCDQCKSNTNQEKFISVFRAPKIFVIQLKRFKLDFNTLKHTKNDSFVAFDIDNIDLTQFIEKQDDILEFNKKILSTGPDFQNENDQIKKHQYKVFAIINHQGSLEYGHYFSFIRNKQNDWYCVNDSQVFKIDKEDVCSSNNYILFLQKSE